ncbi:hypothetical protein [Agriterribacter sp.]|uniref:hypothetical protein n=1 Tax=Agriterribacter sp. TaxID=2821509 RepID=UPI002BCC0F53|nr:hypothetical protein [Agriterribacter sp.]HTN07031.1 hypothetical protein [Agriterribacter sp.]
MSVKLLNKKKGEKLPGERQKTTFIGLHVADLSAAGKYFPAHGLPDGSAYPAEACVRECGGVAAHSRVYSRNRVYSVQPPNFYDNIFGGITNRGSIWQLGGK